MRQSRKIPNLDSVSKILLYYQSDPYQCINKLQEFLEKQPDQTVHNYSQYDEFLTHFGENLTSSIDQQQLAAQEELTRRRKAAEKIRTAKIHFVKNVSQSQIDVNIPLPVKQQQGVKSANSYVKPQYQTVLAELPQVLLQPKKVVQRENSYTKPLAVPETVQTVQYQSQMYEFQEFKSICHVKRVFLCSLDIVFKQVTNNPKVGQLSHSKVNHQQIDQSDSDDFDDESSQNEQEIVDQDLILEPIKERFSQQQQQNSDDFDEDSDIGKNNLNLINDLFAQKQKGTSFQLEQVDDYFLEDINKDAKISVNISENNIFNTSTDKNQQRTQGHSIDQNEFELVPVMDEINVKIDLEHNDAFGSFDFGDEIGGIQF